MTPKPRPKAARTRVWASGAAVLAVAAAGPLLAACGTDTAATPPVAAGSTSGGVTTVAGQQVRVPADKPTALFFFSVGCGECAGGAKSLAQAAAQTPTGAQFLAVDMDPSESAQDITAFLKSVDAPHLPAAIDTGAALTQRYGVSALSTLIVVDPAGTVTYRATDPAPDAIRAALTTAGARP